MFKCPHYVAELNKYLHTLSVFKHVLTDTNYFKMFNNLSNSDAISMYYFFNYALTRRRLYLEDIETV